MALQLRFDNATKGMFISIVVLIGSLTWDQPLTAQKPGAVAFTDLGSHTAEQPAISRMVEQGIMRGKSAEQFAPDAAMTRGEFVVALQQMFQLQTPSQRVAVSDVPPGNSLDAAVQAAQPFLGRQLLCFGCALGSNFLPNQPMTQAEQTMALTRVLVAQNKLQLLAPTDAASVLAEVKDAGSLSPPAAPYFATAIKGGVLTLQADKTIGLATPQTRVNVATTLDAVQQKFSIPQVRPTP